MKTKYTLTDWYLENRWRMRKFSRPCDWTIIGIATRWAGPSDVCYKFCFIGLELRFWFKKEEIV